MVSFINRVEHNHQCDKRNPIYINFYSNNTFCFVSKVKGNYIMIDECPVCGKNLMLKPITKNDK